jgi:hypothetical protein
MRRLQRGPLSARSGRGAVCAVILLGIVAALGGCSVSAPEGNEPVSENEGSLILCSEPGRRFEYYVRPAIENKLRAFPEFASYVGLSFVSNCAQGAQYQERYDAYSLEHPGFDDGQPLGELPVIAQDSVATNQQKLINGVPPDWEFPNNPVIRFRSPAIPGPPAGQPPSEPEQTHSGTCTGTFVSRDMFVTAAHCMSRTRTGSDTFARDLHGNVSYEIQWYVAGGTPTFPQTLDVTQYPNPDYASRDDSSNDIAIVYVGPWLNPDAANQSAELEDGGAMRLTTTQPVISATAPATYMAGAGYPDAVLKAAPMRITGYGLIGNNTHPSTQFPPRTFHADLSGSDDPAVCSGDSGGPAYRMADLGGGRGQAQVMIGVLHSRYGEPDPLSPCATPGNTQIWTSVFAHLPFLKRTLRYWYFPCDTPAGKDYSECWGAACTSDAGCPNSQVCGAQHRCQLRGRF